MDKEMIRRFAYALFGAGVALIGEHIIEHGYTEWEFFGHETYGLIMIIISWFLLLKRWYVDRFECGERCEECAYAPKGSKLCEAELVVWKLKNNDSVNGD